MNRELTFAKCVELWQDDQWPIAPEKMPTSIEDTYREAGLSHLAYFFDMLRKSGDFHTFTKIASGDNLHRNLPRQTTTWAEILQRINRAIEHGIIKWPEDF